MTIETLIQEIDKYLKESNQKEIRLSFRPSPTGLATIGNLKGFLLIRALGLGLSGESKDKKYLETPYKVKYVFRYDDSNPSEDYKKEHYDSFINCMNRFDIPIDQIYYCSKNIENLFYHSYVQRVLNENLGFICNCKARTLEDQDNCVCKNNSELQQLKVSQLNGEVVKYSFKDGSSQVIFRKINDYYCPTLVFQGPIDDYAQNINVILRGRDLESVGIKQKEIYESLFKKPYPINYYWGRVQIWDSVSNRVWDISKSKLKDTKGFPALESFYEFGYSNQAITQWVLSANYTKNDIKWDLVKLNSFQRNFLGDLRDKRVTSEKKFKLISDFEELNGFEGYFIICSSRYCTCGLKTKDDKIYLYERQLSTYENGKIVPLHID